MLKPKLFPFALGLLLAGHSLMAATAGAQPRDMKLLVISVDGTEPSFAAITSFLNSLGIPYQTMFAKKQPLPVLSDATKGYYQASFLRRAISVSATAPAAEARSRQRIGTRSTPIPRITASGWSLTMHGPKRGTD